MRSIILCLVLLAASPCAAAEVHTPWSCMALGRLHNIDVPSTSSIEDARAGLAQAEQRADANLPGVRFCLAAARRAIAKAEKRK